MSLDRFYKNGSNRTVASGTLGAFWTGVFPDNGLVKAVITASTRSMGVAEALMREFPEWLTGGTRDVLSVDRLEVIPVDAVTPEMITGSDGYLIGGGAYFGAQSPTTRWKVPLSESYEAVPLVVPLGGKPLMNGVDYFHSGDKLLFRANPKALGIEPAFENVNNIPTLSWSFLLAGCTPTIDTPKSNWSFYDIPKSARRELMDILTQEASEDRLLRFIQACIGVKGPTVFELSDATGVYTTLQATWVEEGRTYGVTSGKELICVPKGWSFETGFSADGNVLRPASQLAHGISIDSQYSDGDGIGLSTNEIFIPNLDSFTEPAWMSGIQVSESWYGYLDPTGEMTARLETALAKIGKTLGTFFPAVIAGNCIKLFYDTFGRKQPAVISLDAKSAAALAKAPGAFKAAQDSLPAGTDLIFAQNVEPTDSVAIGVTDTTEIFNALDYLDSASVHPAEYSAVPRKSAL